MFGRIVKKDKKSTTLLINNRTVSLPFETKHSEGDIIDDKDNLLLRCKNKRPLKSLKENLAYYTQKFSILKAIREFFSNRGFIEVLTPKLKDEIIHEANINYIETPAGFLASSPEVEIKKLLSLGFDKLFELSFAYRDDHKDRLHKKEFIILEWYEVLAKPKQIIERLIELIKHLNGSDKLKYRGLSIDLNRIEYIPYKEAFERFAGIDIEREEKETLKKRFGIEGSLNRWEIADAIFGLRIEKKLGTEHPVVIYNFPKERAALARIENGYAKRFELYIAGVELANCYDEENDPNRIRERFNDVDEYFIEALEFGIPPTSGIAVGIDRLIMILLNRDSIW
ncbi:amino acid--tRNA ligase-related protein [Hippea sp. KM1]|uniref:amino acid--tRNA ligase-related protein n=1 Tax=Hippea sp. KM1 TaxID=944481 RepID=UPI00046D2AFD|nr:amino acid--tRNA ligase-related protein [Hippea sp. KM1]